MRCLVRSSKSRGTRVSVTTQRNISITFLAIHRRAKFIPPTRGNSIFNTTIVHRDKHALSDFHINGPSRCFRVTERKVEDDHDDEDENRKTISVSFVYARIVATRMRGDVPLDIVTRTSPYGEHIPRRRRRLGSLEITTIEIHARSIYEKIRE